MKVSTLFSLLPVLIFLNVKLLAQSNKIVHVSKEDDFFPAETSVAINPQNPKNIICAFIARVKEYKGTTNFTYSSFDGGESWLRVPTANPDERIEGDDAVAFGNDGMAYHSYISFYGSWDYNWKRQSSGIYVDASNDGGRTWFRRSVVVDHINTSAPMEDKPYVIADNSKDSKFKNNVYLAWTHFAVYGSYNHADSSQIYFSRSVDSGKTFSTPMRISDTGGDCIDSSNTVEGAITAVGPEGQVYVVWAGPKGLVMTESLDGGKTFGANKVIGYIYHGWDKEVPGIGRANGMPVTKIDNSYGPNRGTIYVNWIDDRNGDPDVFLKYSRDEGKTWSNSIRVNDDKLKNGKYQFFTWMAVDPGDGSVNIAFYDRRDYDSTITGLTLARSTDGGKTFVNYKINQAPFNCSKKLFFGDYIGIDAYNGEVITTYMFFKNEDINGKPRPGTAVNSAIFHFKPGSQQQLN